MTTLLSFGTTSVCLVLGLIVYVRNIRHPAHQAIALLSVCLALWSLTNWLSLQPFSEQQRFFWVRAVMVVTAPIPFFFLRFALNFPYALSLSSILKKRREKFRRLMPLIAVWTLLLMFLAMTPLMFRSYQVHNGIPSIEADVGAFLYGLSFLFLSIWSISLLLQSYHSQVGLVRLQVGYVLTGLSLTIVVGFFLNFVLVIFLDNFSFVALGPLSAIFLISLISYAMLKHRLLDLRLTILRFLAYGITLVVSCLAYIFLLNDVLLPFGERYFMVDKSLLTLISMVGVVITFPLVLERIQKWTQRIFYSSVFKPDQAHQILATIVAEANTSEKLLCSLDGFFCTQFGVRWCGFWTNHSSTEGRLKKVIERVAKQAKGSTLMIGDDLLGTDLGDTLQEHDVGIVAPLRVAQQIFGWMCIGRKHSGNAFTPEEIRFCEVVSPQMALALKHVSDVDQIKDEFVSIASHELRTPMTAIRSYLWLCLFKPTYVLPDSVRQHLQVAYSATERLLELVRDLLTTTQVESNQVTISLQYVQLEEVVKRSTAELEEVAKLKGIQIKVFSKVQNSLCLIDPSRVMEILQNLIGNAVKFSPQKSTVLIVLDGSIDKVWVEVSDVGVGIHQSDLEKLFSKFGVIQSSYRKSHEQGTGLGLYIAQKIAKLHHGNITVSSTVGKGSTFRLTLPREQHKDSSLVQGRHVYAKNQATITR